MKVILIASIAHAINAAYCMSLGDNSIPAWDDAPEQQRNSIIAGVEMHLANPDATPEQSHESWLAQKLADGWIYGEVKDPELKQHPCVLPYDELPPEQKAKDYLFRAVVHALKDIETADEMGQQLATIAKLSRPIDHVPVKYIGDSEEWYDRLYNSNLTFQRNQTRYVPGNLAREFLRHIDIFEKGDEESQVVESEQDIADDDDTAELLEEGKAIQQAKRDNLSQIQNIFDQIDQMGKASLTEYARNNYKQDLNQRMTLAEMRVQVRNFIDQFGVV